jgi:hypothetical protein
LNTQANQLGETQQGLVRQLQAEQDRHQQLVQQQQALQHMLALEEQQEQEGEQQGGYGTEEAMADFQSIYEDPSPGDAMAMLSQLFGSLAETKQSTNETAASASAPVSSGGISGDISSAEKSELGELQALMASLQMLKGEVESLDSAGAFCRDVREVEESGSNVDTGVNGGDSYRAMVAANRMQELQQQTQQQREEEQKQRESEANVSSNLYEDQAMLHQQLQELQQLQQVWAAWIPCPSLLFTLTPQIMFVYQPATLLFPGDPDAAGNCGGCSRGATGRGAIGGGVIGGGGGRRCAPASSQQP